MNNFTICTSIEPVELFNLKVCTCKKKKKKRNLKLIAIIVLCFCSLLTSMQMYNF